MVMNPFRHITLSAFLSIKEILIRTMIVRQIISVQIRVLINHVLSARPISKRLSSHIIVGRIHFIHRHRTIAGTSEESTTHIKRQTIRSVVRETLVDHVPVKSLGSLLIGRNQLAFTLRIGI